MADQLGQHRPVMPREVLTALDPGPGKCLLDGTVGMGGHSELWLEACGDSGRVLAFDRDLSAIRAARQHLDSYRDRCTFFHADYRDAPAEIESGGCGRPDAVLLDLGLGSHQIDDPQRGFSFRFDGPLDMRFDRDRCGPTAAEIIAQSSEPELARILSEYGEERAAKKIARRIAQERQRNPIRTTGQLANLIRNCVPSRGHHQRIDPATRTFQALRIAVNSELKDLDQALTALIDLLPPGGRIVVIAFQSLEDRTVKQTLRRVATRVYQQPGDPPGSAREPILEMPQRKVVAPSTEEVAVNPRARSARLRWGVKL